MKPLSRLSRRGLLARPPGQDLYGGADFVRACPVEMYVNMSQESQEHTRATLYGIFLEKCRSPAPIEPHFVRACAIETQGNISQEPHYTEIDRKMPRPRLKAEREHTLCASLRSRSARQHFTGATLYGNLQDKCRGPD